MTVLSETNLKRTQALFDLEEIRRAVFGDIGDEPNVYSDYDRLSELAGKMHAALGVLRPGRAVMGIPVSVGGGFACDCGVRDIDECLAGMDCTAVPMTKEIRQRQSAAALADRPRRVVAKRAELAEYHRSSYSHVYDRLAALGFDPHELKDFLETLPPRE